MLLCLIIQIFDSAIIGVSHDDRVVYDYDEMVVGFAEENGITEEDAIDFIEFNTIRSLPYVEDSPIIVHRIFDYMKE